MTPSIGTSSSWTGAGFRIFNCKAPLSAAPVLCDRCMPPLTPADDSATPTPTHHLARAPTASFWRDTLFFGRFDAVVAAAAAQKPADLLKSAFPVGPTRSVVTGILDRAGRPGAGPLHLALVGEFTNLKHSDAIDAVARAALDRRTVEDNRTKTGKIRRHAALALLYEREPRLLAHVALWNRHLSRRRTHYRRPSKTAPALVFSRDQVRAAAAEALRNVRKARAPGFANYDEITVVPTDSTGEMLVALREWPGRSTGRSKSGDVVTVDLPDWTILQFGQGGRRLAVTDSKLDRGARFAAELIGCLAGAPARYEVILEELSLPKLDEFLEMVTDPLDGRFGLIEIDAEAAWRAHRWVTIQGTANHTAEDLVQDLRRLHPPFAMDSRTVRSVKLRFEKKYKIQVHFPPPGEPIALSYSDIGRSPAVTSRFVALLKKHLHVEVSSKVRSGTARPTREEEQPSKRKGSLGWWRAILGPKVEAPPEWLDMGVRAIADEGLIKTARTRVFDCGSPYIDRDSIPVDSLDCEGEVVLPAAPDADDPCQDEDDGLVCCSRSPHHRWSPERFGLPTRIRLEIAPNHPAIWTKVCAQLAHYAHLRFEPSRPGVAFARFSEGEAILVYPPLVEDASELDPSTFGSRDKPAWVGVPWERPLDTPDQAVELAAILAGVKVLADVWGPLTWKRRNTALKADGVAVPTRLVTPEAGVRIFTLRQEGLFLDGEKITTAGHRAMEVFDGLRIAAAADESDGDRRRGYAWDGFREHLLGRRQPTSKNQWEQWVSRSRGILRERTGEADIGAAAVVTQGDKYRLGDGFLVVDSRVQADDGD